MLVVPLQSVWAVTPFVAVGYLACRTPLLFSANAAGVYHYTFNAVFVNLALMNVPL